MSITAVAAQRILDALLARIKNGSIFTAYDVTIDARDGTDDNIRHSDTRNIVHQEFTTGEFPDEYNREEFLELKNGHVAICYYPDGKSAFDHPEAVANQSVAQAQQSATAPAPIVATATTAPTTKLGGSVKDGGGYICSETKKGVINIPDAIVKAVTPNGGTYDIQIDGGGVIYKAPDGKGRLRIASSKLGGGSKFRLEVVTNTITVEQI